MSVSVLARTSWYLYISPPGYAGRGLVLTMIYLFKRITI